MDGRTSLLRISRFLSGLLIGVAAVDMGHPALGATAPSTLAGSYSVHDPSRVVTCDGKYYVYYTGPHCPVHVSTDLVHWSDGKNVLDTLPEWATKLVPKAKIADAWIWAPDVVKVGDVYYLFWSLSTFGAKTSVIGLSVSPSLDPANPKYGWQDRGLVVASNDHSDYNAIDPCPILDTAGNLWLTFGSWNKGGIEIVKLDKGTGRSIGDPVSIAAGQAAGPEASYLYYRKGFYYLFDNEGTCCQGTHSTYHVMMGRSKSIGGPYLDKAGRDLAHGGGSAFMAGMGDTFGPGHVGIATVKGKDVVTYHYYDGTRNGWPELGITDLTWDTSGWPRSPWKSPSTLANGSYAIVSKLTGLALTVDGAGDVNGAAINQEPLGGGSLQTWHVESTGDGFYRIVSAGTGKALDLFGCSADDGTKIDQYSWFDNACQHWKLQSTGSTWSITSMAGGGAVSTATKESVAGTPVLQHKYTGDPGQLWEFKQVDPTERVSRSHP